MPEQASQDGTSGREERLRRAVWEQARGERLAILALAPIVVGDEPGTFERLATRVAPVPHVLDGLRRGFVQLMYYSLASLQKRVIDDDGSTRQPRGVGSVLVEHRKALPPTTAAVIDLARECLTPRQLLDALAEQGFFPAGGDSPMDSTLLSAAGSAVTWALDARAGEDPVERCVVFAQFTDWHRPVTPGDFGQ
jgi:hypothetical protein